VSPSSGQGVILDPPQVLGPYVCSKAGSYWLLAGERMERGEPFMAGVGGSFVGGKEPFMEQPTLTTRPIP